MTQFTGRCLCGAVSFEAEGKPLFMANCHCTDCKRATGAAYATQVFMRVEDVSVMGETKSYSHEVDSGNILSKEFCPTCGSQMFTKNGSFPDKIQLRAGSINEQENVQPMFNVFASKKMDCTLLDPNITAFDKMPTK